MKSESITVVGSIALDDVETPSGKVTDALGGSATYFSCMASIFTHVELVGVVGKDFPDEHEQMLAGRGIGLSGLEKKHDGETFHWYGRYGDDVNNAETLDVKLNVFEKFEPKISDAAAHSDLLFLANIDPDLQQDVLNQVQRPRLIFCDTMNLWIEHKRASLAKLLTKVDGVFLNDGEARMLSGERNLIKAARIIGDMGPRVVVIKKGEHGAQLWVDGELAFVSPFPVLDVIDPTGAGDTFAAGFLGRISEIKGADLEDFREAIYYATACSSYTIEAFSVDQIRELTREAIYNRVEHIIALSSPNFARI